MEFSTIYPGTIGGIIIGGTSAGVLCYIEAIIVNRFRRGVKTLQAMVLGARTFHSSHTNFPSASHGMVSVGVFNQPHPTSSRGAEGCFDWRACQTFDVGPRGDPETLFKAMLNASTLPLYTLGLIVTLSWWHVYRGPFAV